MKRKYLIRDFKLKNKLILVFFLLVSFSTVLIAISLGTILVNYAKTSVLESREEILSNTLDIIEEKLAFIDDQVYNILWFGGDEKNQLLKLLEMKEVSSNQNSEYLKEFQDTMYMSVFGSVSKYIDSIFIIGENGLRLYNKKPYNYKERDYLFYLNLKEIKETDKRNGKLYWFFTTGDIDQKFESVLSNDYQALTGIRKLQTWQYQQKQAYMELGYIVYKLKKHFFYDYPSIIRLSKDEDLLIVDGEGEYHLYEEKGRSTIELLEAYNSIKDYEAGTYQIEIDKEETKIIVAKNNRSDLSLVLFKSNRLAKEESYQILRNIFLIVIGLLFVSIIFALIIAEGITKPIKNILQKMREVGKGDFDIVINEDRKDEIGTLAHNYNVLISDIKRLFEIEKENQRKIRKAELKALQVQIKPHFLYNTLDMIYNRILRKGNEKDAALIMSFSNFFRLSLNQGREVTTIEDELLQVENYLILQRVRFDYSFDYVIVAKDNITKCLCIPLVVQPLVENSLIHGIMKGDIGSCIKVIARKENDYIIIDVIDDGIGFNEKEMKDRINNINSNSGSYGLKNVNERIRLYYGEKYGIEFEDLDSGGARVCIKIPYIKAN